HVVQIPLATAAQSPMQPFNQGVSHLLTGLLAMLEAFFVVVHGQRATRSAREIDQAALMQNHSGNAGIGQRDHIGLKAPQRELQGTNPVVHVKGPAEFVRDQRFVVIFPHCTPPRTAITWSWSRAAHPPIAPTEWRVQRSRGCPCREPRQSRMAYATPEWHRAARPAPGRSAAPG